MWRTSVETYVSTMQRRASLSQSAKMKCVFHSRMDSGILYAEEIKAPTFYGQGMNGVADQPMTKERPWSTAVFMK